MIVIVTFINLEYLNNVGIIFNSTYLRSNPPFNLFDARLTVRANNFC